MTTRAASRAMGAVLTACLLLAPLPTAHTQSAPARVTANGVELHYIEEGRGEPLILLHGGQGDYRAWGPQMAALAPQYRVIAYSRRFHYPNANVVTATNHSALVDAADLAAFIAARKLAPVHLVGTSYGAFTALAFAIAHPTQVRSLVLAEPPVHQWVTHTPHGETLYRDFMTRVHTPAGQAFADGNPEAAIRIFIDAFDGPGTFDHLPAERRQAILANAAFFRALTQSTDPFPNLSKDAVARLRMPVLLIRGERTDDLHRLVVEELARVVPHATLKIIPAAGHGSPRQNPQAFTAAVAAFLSRVK